MLSPYTPLDPHTKKVLICGDSFVITDSKYPGLHFSEKIANSYPHIDWHILNLSSHGDSNLFIVQQLLQGLVYKPDFVIFSFTAPTRTETVLDKKMIPRSLNLHDIHNWNKGRYNLHIRTIPFFKDTDQNDQLIMADDERTYLQQYILITFCLELCKNMNIPYCYSLGGMKSINTKVFDSIYATNPLTTHKNKEIPLNLWDHSNGTNDPDFHVVNEDIQEKFANMCLNHILESFKS